MTGRWTGMLCVCGQAVTFDAYAGNTRFHAPEPPPPRSPVPYARYVKTIGPAGHIDTEVRCVIIMRGVEATMSCVRWKTSAETGTNFPVFPADTPARLISFIIGKHALQTPYRRIGKFWGA